MNKSKVCAGTRFYFEDGFSSIQYYFGYARGRDLIMRRKGGYYIGDVTAVTDEGFELTVWVMNKAAKVFISFDEIAHVKAKNDFQ